MTTQDISGLTHEQLRHELAEQAKKLNCLLEVSHLVDKPGLTLGELLQEIADLMPGAWQYPEIACARIVVGERDYRSSNYSDGPWKQVADIVVRDGPSGRIEICYTLQGPLQDEGPFRNDERALLDTIARRIGRVIERSRVEEALRDSEARFRHVFECSSFGMAMLNPRGRFLKVNYALCHMLGYTEPEMLSMLVSDVTHPDDASRTVELMADLIENREDNGWLEKRCVRKDGRIVWTMLSIWVMCDSVGDPVHLVAQLQDVTERKRAEEALRKSEERYRIIADFNYDWEWWIGVDGKLLYVSPSSERLTGFAAEEFYNDPELLIRVVHPEDRAAFLAHLAQAAGEIEDTTHSFDFRIVKKQGDERWLNHACRTVYSSDGTPLGRRVSHRDVTDRRIAEEELRKSEERFRAIFENAKDSIFLKDRKLRYSQVNPAMFELLGLPQKEIVGREPEDVFGQEAGNEIRQGDLRVLAGHSVEKIHTRPVKGMPMTFHEVEVPLRDSTGRVIGICGISRNVTELTKANMPPPPFVGKYKSKAMRETLRHARMAAASDATILLLGESGSGKDFMARWVHEHSARASGPYFVLNCAALSHELAESELFGHEAGAFTGARTKKKGLVELAEGGTLVLNEIGELPTVLQSKLLTFLDTRSFMRVGGLRSVQVNVRLVAATHRDLEKEITKGRFIEALFHRLNVFPIKVPPLRDRAEDIPLLVEEILTRLAAEMQLQKVPRFDPAAVASLCKYHWPGNVRELRNAAERALILAGLDCSTIQFSFLGVEADDWKYSVDFASGRTLPEIKEDITRSLCVEALRRCRGNRSRAAQLLGISRDSLYRYIEQFRLHLGAGL